MGAGPTPSSEEHQLALLVTGALDYAIFVMDPGGHILTWNAGAERLKGYRREEIIGRHFSTFHTEEDLARDHPAEELRLALRDGRYEEEGWRVRKDGSQFWANIVITAVYDEAGTHVGFGKVSRDLSARRKVEEQARAKARELEVANRQLAEFQRLVTSVRDYAIFMLDPSGRIRSWNTGARRLKGYAPEEIIGRHFSTFYLPEDRARDHPGWELEEAQREGRYEEEGWRVRKDGSRFWASVTITAIRDDEGRLTGFAKVTRDLTERKAAEDALREAVVQLRRANEELDRFASVAAHDMLDPLRTISGFAKILTREGLPANEVREYAAHVESSSERLTGMLGALLTYARAGRAAHPGHPVELLRVAEEVLADLAGAIQESGATVRLEVPPDGRVVSHDNDLRIVLQNLVVNALKFAETGSPAIAIRAERRQAGEWAMLVEDNGSGIPEPDQRRVFEPFERAHSHQRGYGIGLAICRRLVERHGGELGVRSEVGRGSCFWFTMPGGADTPADAGEDERDPA